MKWIVIEEDKGLIKLISKTPEIDSKEEGGILHNGSYLTIEEKNKGRKIILRVTETRQYNPYSPSPMIVDMDLSGLSEDQKCQNIVYATRIIEYPERSRGISSFILPRMIARKSNQDEIDIAFGTKAGMKVFPASTYARNCQNLSDENGKFIEVKVPDETFFYQMLVTGRTGSGKTVAMKYMAQYFLEEMEGAVLAINVKEEDMLTMDKPSNKVNQAILKEWSDLGLEPCGVESYKIYYPGYRTPKYSKNINIDNCEKITLQTRNLDPETLVGLIQNISDRGADQLPAIFRFWKEEAMEDESTLIDFVNYFADPNKERKYATKNSRGEEGLYTVFPGTYNNILNALNRATEYFDVDGASEIDFNDILQPRKMSIIDMSSKSGFGFGSVLLRDLLDKIYEAKSQGDSDVPVLIIIDEVHEFYGGSRSKEALQTLDSICRKGRSLKIGVIFASQNPEDMPKGIGNVVNSKIFFKSNLNYIKSLGIKESGFDPEAFRPGYGVARIHGLSQLRFVKFPLSLAGVIDDKKENR